MVAPNKWEFQASVWEAAQPQLKLRQQHSEAKNEGGSEETPASPIPCQDDSGESIQHFQYTDFPHPDWEQIVSSTNAEVTPPLLLPTPPAHQHQQTQNNQNSRRLES